MITSLLSFICTFTATLVGWRWVGCPLFFFLLHLNKTSEISPSTSTPCPNWPNKTSHALPLCRNCDWRKQKIARNSKSRVWILMSCDKQQTTRPGSTCRPSNLAYSSQWLHDQSMQRPDDLIKRGLNHQYNQTNKSACRPVTQSHTHKTHHHKIIIRSS